ncbi:hypothetical protein BDP55DRAFT_79732 [Colletotrichum godetiae]|uniref:C2H2-type domain-containing protein n=1 Tax=Colletotrichum godetiae TaxID=1209918 RepID=A0AAJ0A6B1_9PEZI|nr:uncharacterized protein BDP55DRAFT_79732 [Colletotrichum godetiae]KAK1656693.1 hypothetical protein BDP55DRAFT_79732 [Colletotrichum godetiae]
MTGSHLDHAVEKFTNFDGTFHTELACVHGSVWLRPCIPCIGIKDKCNTPTPHKCKRALEDYKTDKNERTTARDECTDTPHHCSQTPHTRLVDYAVFSKRRTVFSSLSDPKPLWIPHPGSVPEYPSGRFDRLEFERAVLSDLLSKAEPGELRRNTVASNYVYRGYQVALFVWTDPLPMLPKFEPTLPTRYVEMRTYFPSLENFRQLFHWPPPDKDFDSREDIVSYCEEVVRLQQQVPKARQYDGKLSGQGCGISGAIDPPGGRVAAVSEKQSLDGPDRSHPWYLRGPTEEGQYHCPDKECREHLPTRSTPSYQMYVDCHTKPYRCRIRGCNIRFIYKESRIMHEEVASHMDALDCRALRS